MRIHSKGRYRSSFAAPRIEFRPSGHFCFRIREALSMCHEPTFFDRPEHPLECQLSIILHGLSIAALELREKAEKRETERRAEEQIAHQQRLAEAQFRKLNEHLEDWMKSEALHRLIARVHRKMESEGVADLFVMDSYDIALCKLKRDNDRDFQDLLFLARTTPFDLDVFEQRYREEFRPYLFGSISEADFTFARWMEAIKEDRAKTKPCM